MSIEDDLNPLSPTIWELTMDQMPGVFEVEVPRGAEFLSCGEQADYVAIWFRCDPHTKFKTKRKIALCMTGEPAPTHETGRFIGTVLCDRGRFVLHVFEERRDERNRT